jgi:hypothetical protein
MEEPDDAFYTESAINFFYQCGVMSLEEAQEALRKLYSDVSNKL